MAFIVIMNILNKWHNAEFTRLGPSATCILNFKVTGGPEWERSYIVKIILQFRSTKPLNMENCSVFMV